jgi:hypothetical protein
MSISMDCPFEVQNIALGGTKSTYVDWLITTTRKYFLATSRKQRCGSEPKSVEKAGGGGVNLGSKKEENFIKKKKVIGQDQTIILIPQVFPHFVINSPFSCTCKSHRKPLRPNSIHTVLGELVWWRRSSRQRSNI